MPIYCTARSVLALFLSFSLISSTCIAQPVAQTGTRQFLEDRAGFPQYPTAQSAPQRGGQTAAAVVGTASLNFPPDRNDSVAQNCDQLADRPQDAQRVGDGVAFENIQVDQALPVCRQAAERQPARPRYQYLYGRVLDAAKRYPEALALYTAADKAGYGAASFALAGLYQDALGVPQDLEQALRLYFRAGNAGIADAFDEGGAIYAQENPPNYLEAKSWLEHAVRGGSPDGYADLGVIYGSGFGVPQNATMAMNLFSEAVKRGSVEGMFRLGLAYRYGEGTQRNPAAGCQWLIKAAETGHPYAEQEAGRCYYNGLGVASDHLAAFNWFAKAGQAGVIDSKVITADMLDSGDGWNQDKAYAVMWYRAAANLGDVYAMTQLGAHLRLGQGTAKNEAEAMQWFLKAAEKGYVPAENSLAMGYESGQSYQQAASWFGKAADQDDGYAQLNLGVMYEKGWGVPQNLERAKQLYARAAGSSDTAVAKLGSQYFSDVPNPASPGRTPDRSAVSSAKNSSDFWSVVIVGALAIGAIALLSSGGSSSTSSSVATPSAPFTPLFPSSPSTSPAQPVTAFPGPPPPHPMIGNTGKILNGEAGLGFDNVIRK